MRPRAMFYRDLVILAVFAGLTGALPVIEPAAARPLAPQVAEPVWLPGEHPDNWAPSPAGARPDTTWFGGDDGSGSPFAGGVWDWDTIVTDPLQGWVAVDATANPGVYFARVTAADFAAHDDPCTPMILGTEGMLWCGIHEDEARRRDFLAGMGYQNAMCQWAFSPEYPVDPAADEIGVSFLFFNHSEPEYDYTFIRVQCFDNTGELLDEVEVDDFTGMIGSAAAPATFDAVIAPAGTLDPGTVTVRIALQVTADGAWSDEDGYWDSPCGPFAADDIAIAVGSDSYFYSFEESAEGWTFERCQSVGSYTSVIPEETWGPWLDEQVACECDLDRNVIGFVDFQSPYWPPGMVHDQHEFGVSGPVPRAGCPGAEDCGAVVEYDAYLYMLSNTGAYYRNGYMYYPYTTEVNPEPHWSPRNGPEAWFNAAQASCALHRYDMSGSENPPPAGWDSLKFVYEVYCSCEAFTVPGGGCEEGRTHGSPLLDNARIGITENPASFGPNLSCVTGGYFHDGFGQLYPTYLEPSDRGDANIGFNLSLDNPQMNDWLGDSTVVTGPIVQGQVGRWLAEFCFRVTRLGARQEMIPEYHAWKARLPSDPEQGFVCVLMDSLETANHTIAWKNKFASYFHEDAPGFDPAHPDFSEAQEILPDKVFTPGTSLAYYFRSYWYNGGTPPQEYNAGGVHEFAILPDMQVAAGETYEVEWPSVLYVDAYGRGSERFIVPALDRVGLRYDKFDYAECASCYGAPMKRSYGGSTYNPGGYGNNGCTTEQLLGYRLVLLNTGRFSSGALDERDFELFEEWLASTACGLGDVRRGLMLSGDEIAVIMGDPRYGVAIDFCHNVLGVEPLTGGSQAEGSYREYNEDDAYCVYLEPTLESVFEPAEPGNALFGNWCPQQATYTVLGKWPGAVGVVGNLAYYSYEQTGTQTYVNYAQIVREHTVPGEANWRTTVDGFSWHHVTERGCHGQPCSHDSACVVDGMVDLLEPQLEWLGDPGDLFTPWRYPCTSTSVETEPEFHISGPVDHLDPTRPNPFHTRATIRFHLARAGEACVTIFDVGGRAIRALHTGPLAAGEHALVWDGTDGAGRRVGKGIFWTQLHTAGGYRSSMRMVRIE